MTTVRHIQQGLRVPLLIAFPLTCVFVLAGRVLFLLVFMGKLTHPCSVWIGLYGGIVFEMATVSEGALTSDIP